MGDPISFLEIINKKVTSRNIIALSLTGTIIATVAKFLHDPQGLIVTLQENQEFVIAGSVVFGIILAKWSDVIQFYFRKPRSKVEPV